MNRNLFILILFFLSLGHSSNQNNLSNEVERCNCQGPKAFKALTN